MEKRERFKKVAEQRTNKVLKMIELLGNCANTNNYEYTEEEGLPFTWTLESAELTHIHIMETGGSGVPKIYTVTELTETSLKYKDDFGKTYSFVKIK